MFIYGYILINTNVLMKYVTFILTIQFTIDTLDFKTQLILASPHCELLENRMSPYEIEIKNSCQCYHFNEDHCQLFGSYWQSVNPTTMRCKKEADNLCRASMFSLSGAIQAAKTTAFRCVWFDDINEYYQDASDNCTKGNSYFPN